MDSILFSLKTVGTVFIIIAAGVFLRRTGFLEAELCGKLSGLVFHLFLPALVLGAMMRVNFEELPSPVLVLSVWGILILMFLTAWILAFILKIEPVKRGLFASGATWSNVAIVGYALGETLYGSQGLIRAAVFSALVLPVHTFLGYWGMSAGHTGKAALKKVLKGLISSPLMAALFIGWMLSLLPFFPPVFLTDILDILGRAALPLALVAIGGSLEFSPGTSRRISVGAVLVKLVLLPLAALAVGMMLKLPLEWIGTMVLGFSCPTAISFFVVSRSLGHEAPVSAGIVSLTTAFSALSTGAVAALLKTWGLV